MSMTDIEIISTTELREWAEENIPCEFLTGPILDPIHCEREAKQRVKVWCTKCVGNGYGWPESIWCCDFHLDGLQRKKVSCIICKAFEFVTWEIVS